MARMVPSYAAAQERRRQRTTRHRAVRTQLAARRPITALVGYLGLITLVLLGAGLAAAGIAAFVVAPCLIGGCGLLVWVVRRKHHAAARR
jgi:Flp pilus assembly protein TadB